MNSSSDIPSVYCGGEFLEILISEKKLKFGVELQQRIVRQNRRDEKEKVRLAQLAIQFDQSSHMDPAELEALLSELIKSDSDQVQREAAELCSDWAGSDESRLVWFSSRDARGKIRHVELLAESNLQSAVAQLLQYSSCLPLNLDFIKFGIDFFSSNSPQQKNEKIIFAENCSKQIPTAESYFQLLKISQNEKLDELGAILTRAKGKLNGNEFERLHQMWQLNKHDLE